MAENEKTSPRVATIASKIMNMDKPLGLSQDLWDDIKTLAGSALTQSADKAKENSMIEAAAFMAFRKSKGFEEIGKRRPLDVGLFRAMQNASKK